MIRIQDGGQPFYFPGDEIGCLLVHGLTSTPQEMRSLGEHLADRGRTVHGVRLPGHATRPSDMARGRWQDWAASLEDGWHLLREVCERVVTIGLSLGGALSLWFAAHHPVSGVVAMSTPYALPPYPRLPIFPGLSAILHPISAFLRYLPKPPPLDYRNPAAARDHLAYRIYPTRSIAEVVDLLAEMRRHLPQLQVPTLLIHARDDMGVTPANAKDIYGELGSADKALLWVEDSGHVITLDPAHERAFSAVVDFVDRVAGGPQ